MKTRSQREDMDLLEHEYQVFVDKAVADTDCSGNAKATAEGILFAVRQLKGWNSTLAKRMTNYGYLMYDNH